MYNVQLKSVVFISPVNLNCDFPLKNQLLDMSGFHLSSSSPSRQHVLSLFSLASSKSTLKTIMVLSDYKLIRKFTFLFPYDVLKNTHG